MAHSEFRNLNAVAFDTAKQSYIYDSFSNEIFNVSSIVPAILDDSFELNPHDVVEKHKSKFTEDAIVQALSAIRDIQRSENALLAFKIPEFAVSPNGNNPATFTSSLNGRLIQLAFNVTESCNLRCGYCVYSGTYPGRRSHNLSHDISPDLARRAIDFFYAHSRESEERYLSLYGGEPFLRFELVKLAVEYARKVDPEIRIAITSNATLLNETIIRFLSENDVALTLSLDGPKALHDRYRVHRDGRGTFEAVIEKIELIKNKFPDFYSKRLKINSVAAPYDGEIEDIDRFFEAPLFAFLREPQKYAVGLVNPQLNRFVEEHNYDAYVRRYFSDAMSRFLKAHSHSRCDGPDGHLVPRAFLGKQMKMLCLRSRHRLNDYSYFWPNGICIPGVRSLFISSDGRFYPCEKLYDYDDMSIGDIDSGFDLARIKSYVDEYCSRTIGSCSRCWAYRLCGECFLTIRGHDGWDARKREEFCAGQKSMWVAVLTIYAAVLECKPTAFDYLINGEA